MALADEAASDGGLRGKHDAWSLDHLAGRMHLSRNSARDVLRWLEAEGWLRADPQTVTSQGRRPDARWLTIPAVQRSLSVLDGPIIQESGVHGPKIPGPSSKNPGYILQGSNTNVGHHVVTELRSYGVRAPAKASTKPYKTPQQRLDEMRVKAGVR